jgi:transposase
LSRVARDILNLQEIFKNKKVNVHCVKQDLTWRWNGTTNVSDTNMKTMLYSMFAQLERDQLRQRIITGMYNANKDKPEFIAREQRRAAVLDDFLNRGMSREDMATKYNVSYATIQGDIEQFKIHGVLEFNRRQSREEELKPVILLALSQGKSYKEMSELCGVSKKTVSRYITKWRYENSEASTP